MSSNESDVKKFCGNYDNENPLEQSSDGNKMLVKFDSDKLFRYKGFHCRFRAIQSNGISVINSFVDETEGKFIKLTCYSPHYKIFQPLNATVLSICTQFFTVRASRSHL